MWSVRPGGRRPRSAYPSAYREGAPRNERFQLYGGPTMLSGVIYKRRRGRRLVTAGLMAGTLFGAGTVLAVHETGIFQMDGNAATTPNSTPAAREDWDQVCSALLTSLTPAGTCPKASNYTLPTYGTLAAAITA